METRNKSSNGKSVVHVHTKLQPPPSSSNTPATDDATTNHINPGTKQRIQQPVQNLTRHQQHQAASDQNAENSSAHSSVDDNSSDGWYSDAPLDSANDSDSDAHAAAYDSGLPVQKKTKYFHVLDKAQRHDEALTQVNMVAELLCTDVDSVGMLLRIFKWDHERLTEEYLSDPSAVLKRAGLDPDAAGPSREVLWPVAEGGADAPDAATEFVLVGGSRAPASTLLEVQCGICFTDSRTYSALSCGHAFCNDCYGLYMRHKITDEGYGALFATCPEPSCPLRVSAAMVRSLELPADKLAIYDSARSLERSYVDDNPNLRWCPADCGRAVRARRDQLGVRCDCGKRFCFTCSLDDHRPCSCEQLKQWTIKCRDDSETYNWLTSNTKACPKCKTSIEKNGGCNHMTCKNGACKHEFCWVCTGSWKDHANSYYSCNRFNPDAETPEGKKRDDSRLALDHYLHHYTRFTNHHNSLKLEKEQREKTEQKIKEMQALGDNTWLDCQYLVEANSALHECRYVLQYTYVYAYYLDKSERNHKTNFEDNQSSLEKQTEDLSQLLEKPVEQIERSVVVHCFQMARKRLCNLLDLVDSKHQPERGTTAAFGGAELGAVRQGRIERMDTGDSM